MFAEGDASMRETLGGKGANLAQMTKLGLPVPPGFTVSTDACIDYLQTQNLGEKVVLQIKKAIKKLEKLSGKTFGGKKPLILSVRSGARVSMPGMMDSVLNLGLNDEIVKDYANQTSPRFAYDCYRRFIQMYGNVVCQIDDRLFEDEIDLLKKQTGIVLDQDFTAKHLQTLIKNFKRIFKVQTKKSFPQDVNEMLLECVRAVFRSWNNDRAIIYRKMNKIPDDWGTAVNVQMMVFGNLNQQSGTGVCFSRNPTNGKNKFFGEFLMSAQGEDIVAGVRTPQPIEKLQQVNPKAFDELYAHAKKLEKVYCDMQDMEFTIENGKLFILQTRNGKRTTLSSIRIAVDLVAENLIDKETAIQRIEADKIPELLRAKLEIPRGEKPIASGIGASPGGAVGKIALSTATAKQIVEGGNQAILVRLETSPEDITGMNICEGILTARGGTTSHAAVVARGMGTVCVSGCETLQITGKTIKIGGKKFAEGDYISIDGTSGAIFEGKYKTSATLDNKYLSTLLDWAENMQQINVFANADTTNDAKNAIKFNAKGIGLCRTEHMFFDKTRIIDMQKMILATSPKMRSDALRKLQKYQSADFAGIFTACAGRSVTIRLLDPPLHEFMPKTKENFSNLATALQIDAKTLQKQVDTLRETNPMMGHRGLRLAISYPEIYQMQVRAIIESALKVQEKHNQKIVPEIMIPLTSDEKEFLFVKNLVIETIKTVDPQAKIEYKIGTMIETPRACIIASTLAQHADFFSFGTNDLTQFVYGFSRDDAGKFLPEYFNKKILAQDVFMHLDTVGVGALMESVVRLSKRINPKIKIGICGEHAGDPQSIAFCKKIGIDYVSCSPARLPIAKLASC